VSHKRPVLSLLPLQHVQDNDYVDYWFVAPAHRHVHNFPFTYSWSETTVLIVFIITALLWFFREPGFIPGWSVIFKDNYMDDGTVAVTMATLLFFLPSEKPMFLSSGGEPLSQHKQGNEVNLLFRLNIFICSL